VSLSCGVRVAAVACLLAASCARPAAPANTPATAASRAQAPLFDRLGGRPAIGAVVDEMLRRAAHDPRISGRFANADMNRLRNQLVEQICAGSGGPCRYTGKDMRTAHLGMGILGAEFDALVDDLQGALVQLQVPTREQADLIALLAATKTDIVQVRSSAAIPSTPPVDAAKPGSYNPGITTAARATGGSEPIAERAAGLREAAGLLDKAEVERRRGNRSLADQLFSFAELIVGVETLAALAPLFRDGAPPRINTPTTSAPAGAQPQPAAVGSSDEEEPPAKPAKGSLAGTVKVGSDDFDGFAVVTLDLASGRSRRRAPRHRIMEQRNRAFAPHALVVPVGSTVEFPNFDVVYHNVFSRSEVKAFDLGLYKAGQQREVQFDREGIVRVGCNLHANMAGYIAVTSAAHYFVTDAHGHFAFKSLDPGQYNLRVYTERGDEPTTLAITIAPTRNTVTVSLPPGARAAPLPDKFGVPRGQKAAR
jgi:hemoglobin